MTFEDLQLLAETDSSEALYLAEEHLSSADFTLFVDWISSR